MPNVMNFGVESSNLAWNVAGTASGSNPVLLPADFNELIVDTKYGTAGYSFSFIREQLSNSEIVYRNGFYASSGSNVINLRVSLNSIYIETWLFDGTNVLSSSALTVYYR